LLAGHFAALVGAAVTLAAAIVALVALLPIRPI
jgi:hypothetical protein